MKNSQKDLLIFSVFAVIAGVAFSLGEILIPRLFGPKSLLIVSIFSALSISCLLRSISVYPKAAKWFVYLNIEIMLLQLSCIPLISLGKKYDLAGFKLLSIGSAFFSLLILFKLQRSGLLNSYIEKYSRKPLRSINCDTEIKEGDVILCTKQKDELLGIKDEKVVIPYKDRFLHMLILGATGSGKTSQILLPMISQDIKNLNAGVIVFEPKGDLAQQVKFMASHYGREVKYFDPAMIDCPKFNPMAGREIDVVENMAMTFRMLMPDSTTFFLDLGEQLVRYSVKVLKRLDAAIGKEGQYANLNNLSRLLQNSNGDGFKLVTEFKKIRSKNMSEYSENTEIADWFMRDYFPSGSKNYENTSGIRSQVTKICSNEFLRDVLNPDVSKGEKNDIDFDKALAEGEVICISTSQGVLRGLSKFLGYFLILQLQSAVFRRPGTEDTRKACFLYIDEFQTYSTPGFADMLTMGRSYRVASHLATQARAQMEMGGGRDGKEFVSLVSTNARNVVLFPGCSYKDADYYSKQFGEHTELKVTSSESKSRRAALSGFNRSKSVSRQEVSKANMSPTDIIYRPFGEITYSIIKNNTLQPAGIGRVSFIDKDLKNEIDRNVYEYVSTHTRKPTEEIFTLKNASAEQDHSEKGTLINGADPLFLN